MKLAAAKNRQSGIISAEYLRAYTAAWLTRLAMGFFWHGITSYFACLRDRSAHFRYLRRDTSLA